MSLYIFLLYCIYHLCFTCIDFYDLSAWGGCWFDVYIRRFIYKFLNVCPFDYTAVAGSWKVGPVSKVNHTSWVAVVTPTDRPKSVRNRCVIELFCGVFCVVILPFWHFCWCRDFCHRTESDFFLFHLLSAGVLSRKHFRLIVNDGVRRKASACIPLTTGKMNFYDIVDNRIEHFTTHPYLYKQSPSRSV